jgi:kojibiose phosphorylase
LSPSAHAIAPCKLGRPNDAYRYLKKCIALDLADEPGNTAAGIHAANLGGVWQVVAFGFAGLQLGERGLKIEPALPDAWDRLDVPIHYRGVQLTISVMRQRVKVSVHVPPGQGSAEPGVHNTGSSGFSGIRIECVGNDMCVDPGQTAEFVL